ncbi:hypothetical protein HGRIS_006228 [Hohenbuehelia grisea]|uniref:non-specific serine/threonine protein kinase n=1 Tax=Hohenbuehelia grisea TaxID=104357 RepID=A0ABR3JZ77_9AGAR
MLELITGKRVFDLRSKDGLTPTQLHLFLMSELLGPFPPEFIAGCSKRDTFFDAHGKLLHQPTVRQDDSISERLSRSRWQGDILQTSAFIGRMLTIDPKQRPSASELLEDSWFQSEY